MGEVQHTLSYNIENTSIITELQYHIALFGCGNETKWI